MSRYGGIRHRFRLALPIAGAGLALVGLLSASASTPETTTTLLTASAGANNGQWCEPGAQVICAGLAPRPAGTTATGIGPASQTLTLRADYIQDAVGDPVGTGLPVTFTVQPPGNQQPFILNGTTTQGANPTPPPNGPNMPCAAAGETCALSGPVPGSALHSAGTYTFTVQTGDSISSGSFNVVSDLATGPFKITFIDQAFEGTAFKFQMSNILDEFNNAMTHGEAFLQLKNPQGDTFVAGQAPVNDGSQAGAPAGTASATVALPCPNPVPGSSSKSGNYRYPDLGTYPASGYIDSDANTPNVAAPDEIGGDKADNDGDEANNSPAVGSGSALQIVYLATRWPVVQKTPTSGSTTAPASGTNAPQAAEESTAGISAGAADKLYSQSYDCVTADSTGQPMTRSLQNISKPQGSGGGDSYIHWTITGPRTGPCPVAAQNNSNGWAEFDIPVTTIDANGSCIPGSGGTTTPTGFTSTAGTYSITGQFTNAAGCVIFEGDTGSDPCAGTSRPFSLTVTPLKAYTPQYIQVVPSGTLASGGTASLSTSAGYFGQNNQAHDILLSQTFSGITDRIVGDATANGYAVDSRIWYPNEWKGDTLTVNYTVGSSTLKSVGTIVSNDAAGDITVASWSPAVPTNGSKPVVINYSVTGTNLPIVDPYGNPVADGTAVDFNVVDGAGAANAAFSGARTTTAGVATTGTQTISGATGYWKVLLDGIPAQSTASGATVIAPAGTGQPACPPNYLLNSGACVYQPAPNQLPPFPANVAPADPANGTYLLDNSGPAAGISAGPTASPANVNLPVTTSGAQLPASTVLTNATATVVDASNNPATQDPTGSTFTEIQGVDSKSTNTFSKNTFSFGSVFANQELPLSTAVASLPKAGIATFAITAGDIGYGNASEGPYALSGVVPANLATDTTAGTLTVAGPAAGDVCLTSSGLTSGNLTAGQAVTITAFFCDISQSLGGTSLKFNVYNSTFTLQSGHPFTVSAPIGTTGCPASVLNCASITLDPSAASTAWITTASAEQVQVPSAVNAATNLTDTNGGTFTFFVIPAAANDLALKVSASSVNPTASETITAYVEDVYHNVTSPGSQYQITVTDPLGHPQVSGTFTSAASGPSAGKAIVTLSGSQTLLPGTYQIQVSALNSSIANPNGSGSFTVGL